MSDRHCGPLCRCEARGDCQRIDTNEAKRLRIEGAKHMLARYIAEGQKIDGRTPVLEDLIGDDETTDDPLHTAYSRMVASYARGQR